MRLVLTCNIGNLSYATYTIPFMQRYARRMEADFLELTTRANPGSYGRTPTWAKMEAIRFLASQSRYTSLLIVDADVLIMPQCSDIFQHSQGLTSVVQDMGIPQVDDRFHRRCLELFNQAPMSGPYFNSGVLVIPLDTARRCSTLFKGPYPDEWPSDQDSLNWWLSRHEKLTWLPQSFNWLAPQFTDESLQQHMVHFVGDYKSLIPDFVTRVGCAHQPETWRPKAELNSSSHTNPRIVTPSFGTSASAEFLFHPPLDEASSV